MTDVFYNDIVELLNCPLCKEKITPSAVVCSNGHASCSICSEISLSCIKCASIFISNRHILINSIIDATHNKENFIENLIQALECPVCYNPITKCDLCVNGHGVCWQCVRYTQHCPLCKEPYVYNYSSLINSIFEVVNRRIQCINWSQCRTSCFYTELLEHEAVCDKKFCYCIIEPCEWKGNTTDLRLHVSKYHPKVVLPKNDISTKLGTADKVQVNMFMSHGEAFWLLSVLGTHGLLLAIQIHDVICNYTARIILEANDQELKLNHNILTMRDNLIEAVLDGNCLKIPKDIVTRFYLDNQSKCHITILKQKPPSIEKPKQKKSLVLNQIMVVLLAVNVILFCENLTK